MRIGVDIDGVLTDRDKYIIDWATKYCFENNITYRIKPEKHDEVKSLGISSENVDKFWEKYFKRYVTKVEPRAFAVEVLNKLKERGIEIYIITARNEWGLIGDDAGKIRDFTKKWLEDKKIPYDKIVYTEDNKLPYCVGNYIDLMIEDKPSNIKSIATKIPVFCYHCESNANVSGKNITRVYSWYDIYNKIQERNKKDR